MEQTVNYPKNGGFFMSSDKRRFIGSGEDVPFDHELKDLMQHNQYDYTENTIEEQSVCIA
jgi:hypothetical protein